jgi:hypothetical protein
MKRYLLFSLIGPFLGGLILFTAATITSGYWHRTFSPDITRFVLTFLAALPYNYLFGILPVLMFAAADDVLSRMRRIDAKVRIIVVGTIGFAVARTLYGDLGSGTGALDFLLYGMVGLVPAMLCSWLSNQISADRTQNSGNAVKVRRSTE